MRTTDPNPSFDAFAMAAFDPSGWSAALAQAGAALDARLFGIIRFDTKGGTLLAGEAGQGHNERYWTGGWASLDLRARRVLSALPGLMSDDDLVSPEERQASDFYRAFAAAEDVPYSTCLRFDEGGHTYVISMMRGAAQGPARGADRTAFAALAERAHAAAQLGIRLERAREGGLLAGLAQAGEAAILLGWGGALVATTPGAERMMGALIDTKSGRLAAQSARAQRALDQLGAALRHVGGSPPALKRFVIPRPGGRGLLAVPNYNVGSGLDLFAGVRAVLILTDLDAVQRPRTAPTLVQRYGLTPAEGDVAAAIATGASVDAIARERGVTQATVRVLLRRVFTKTGVHRQAELVALAHGLGPKTAP